MSVRPEVTLGYWIFFTVIATAIVVLSRWFQSAYGGIMMVTVVAIVLAAVYRRGVEDSR